MADSELYSRANLFIAVYDHPADGHIRLPDTTRVRIMYGKVNAAGWYENIDGDPWLIIDDGKNFWPVMVKLNEQDDVHQLLTKADRQKHLHQLDHSLADQWEKRYRNLVRMCQIAIRKTEVE